jgi:hypothetical protein
MKTASGLGVIALGAILTFAVSARTPVINLQAVGVIIMVTGLAGLVIPARAGGWLRRRVVLRHVPAEPGTNDYEDLSQPSYLLADPAVMASQILAEAELAEADLAGDESAGDELVDGAQLASDAEWAGEAARADGAAAAAPRARTLRAVGAGPRPDDAMIPDLTAEREAVGSPQRSRAAAVLDDLFNT